MILGQPRGRIVVGVLLALMGAVWTLQGFDLLGQDGGMNGRAEWIVIGAAAVVGGVLLFLSGYRARPRP